MQGSQTEGLKAVAIVPARSGSKRIKDKNIHPINEHPLIAYTICAAREANIFEKIYVATDSQEYASIARYYGAEVPSLRSENISGSHSPDIEWLMWALTEWDLKRFDALSILRPTSPLRRPENIIEAWDLLLNSPKADSVRAISPASIHPGKMWAINGGFMQPILPFRINDVPWHSSQTANLPQVYFQNASLEIVWLNSVLRTKSIGGDIILPYISPDMTGFDINEPMDLDILEALIDKGLVQLPSAQKMS